MTYVDKRIDFYVSVFESKLWDKIGGDRAGGVDALCFFPTCSTTTNWQLIYNPLITSLYSIQYTYKSFINSLESITFDGRVTMV